jgi:hypothetical protein
VRRHADRSGEHWAAVEPLRAGALQRVLAAWERPVSTFYAAYPGR